MRPATPQTTASGFGISSQYSPVIDHYLRMTRRSLRETLHQNTDDSLTAIPPLKNLPYLIRLTLTQVASHRST
jgi:hypothetical protein